MWEWVRWLLAVPLSGTVIGLLYRVAPVPRWTWMLRSRLAIYRDMPDGPERDWYASQANEIARKVREYREAFPTLQKVLGWVAVTYTVLLLTIDLLSWTHPVAHPLLGPILDPIVTVLTLMSWFSMCRSVFLGRTILGLTPEAHRLVVAMRRARHAQRAFERRVRRRARRAFSV